MAISETNTREYIHGLRLHVTFQTSQGPRHHVIIKMYYPVSGKRCNNNDVITTDHQQEVIDSVLNSTVFDDVD